MTHETVTTLGPAEVIAAAKQFFAERVPNNAAFPEKEGPAYLTLRGQGGEEIALAVQPDDGIACTYRCTNMPALSSGSLMMR